MPRTLYGRTTQQHKTTRTRVMGVVKACTKPLQRKTGMRVGRPLGCGIQGCVFPTRYPGRIAKVSVSNDHEAGVMLWQKSLGWNSHWSLPRVYAVKSLRSCAHVAGENISYVTVRENLRSLPRLPHIKSVRRLLESIEDDINEGDLANDAAVVTWLTKHTPDMRKLTKLELHVTFSMLHLAIWLQARGVIVEDLRVGNLGIRHRGAGVDIVVRDPGRFTARRPLAGRFAEKYVRRHAAALGVFLGE
jgi:hypothetical protein